MTPCVDCVTATKQAGILTRCRKHPLESGRSQFEHRPIDWSIPNPRKAVVIPDTSWPARPLFGNTPVRTPFLTPGKSLRLEHVQRGWGPLAKKSNTNEPGWWTDTALIARKPTPRPKRKRT